MDSAQGSSSEYHSNSKSPIKETLILAFSFLFVFTSFQALQNLQSSLNQLHGLGVASLASIYGTSFAVSFFTPTIVYNVGVKGAILMGWLGHCIYVACNFYPHWATLIPGSVLLGFITCPLWVSVDTYLSSLAQTSVTLDEQKTPKVVSTLHAHFSRLNGVFSSIFVASQLTGNLLSSTILFQSSYNQTHVNSSSTSLCGADYCPQAGEGKHTISPETTVIYTMLGVFLALDLTGLSITWCCLTNLEQPNYTGSDVLRKLRSYWLIFSQPKLWLLVPLFACRGMIFSLHIGMFTEAYVSCALGIHMVGFVMAVWGLSTMLSSALFGCAARCTGRYVLFAFAFLVDTAVLLAFLLWRPDSTDVAVFFSLAMVMGLGDGIWGVQCKALIAVLFATSPDAAFSVRSTWGGLSVAVSFVLAIFLCPEQRIYIALGMLGAGLLGYVAVEVLHWHSDHGPTERNQPDYEKINEENE